MEATSELTGAFGLLQLSEYNTEKSFSFILQKTNR
jgi:hypothetical protein